MGSRRSEFSGLVHGDGSDGATNVSAPSTPSDVLAHFLVKWGGVEEQDEADRHRTRGKGEEVKRLVDEFLLSELSAPSSRLPGPPSTLPAKVPLPNLSRVRRRVYPSLRMGQNLLPVSAQEGRRSHPRLQIYPVIPGNLWVIRRREM